MPSTSIKSKKSPRRNCDQSKIKKKRGVPESRSSLDFPFVDVPKNYEK
jgi:hypothetical protein